TPSGVSRSRLKRAMTKYALATAAAVAIDCSNARTGTDERGPGTISAEYKGGLHIRRKRIQAVEHTRHLSQATRDPQQAFATANDVRRHRGGDQIGGRAK